MIKKFIHIGIWSFEYSRVADPYSKPWDPDPDTDSNIFSESGYVLFKNVTLSAALIHRCWISRLMDEKHQICGFNYVNSNQNFGTLLKQQRRDRNYLTIE